MRGPHVHVKNFSNNTRVHSRLLRYVINKSLQIKQKVQDEVQFLISYWYFIVALEALTMASANFSDPGIGIRWKLIGGVCALHDNVDCQSRIQTLTEMKFNRSPTSLQSNLSWPPTGFLTLKQFILLRTYDNSSRRQLRPRSKLLFKLVVCPLIL